MARDIVGLKINADLLDGLSASDFAQVSGSATFSGSVTASDFVVDDGGTIGSTTTTDAITVASDGDVTLTGDLIMGTSGKGIDFSATSDAAGSTSELLDDYEEGTWTPSYAASGGGAESDGSSFGYYTKVGDVVFARFQIARAKNTLSGDITLTGLPFTIRNVSGNGAASVSIAYRFASDMPNLKVHPIVNTTTANVYKNSTNSSTQTSMTDADMLDIAFRNVIAGVLVYAV